MFLNSLKRAFLKASRITLAGLTLEEDWICRFMIGVSGWVRLGPPLMLSNFYFSQVTQYSCDYNNKAPGGCLQYYFDTSGTGTVRTFNYLGSPSYHLANQKQSICVRLEIHLSFLLNYYRTLPMDTTDHRLRTYGLDQSCQTGCPRVACSPMACLMRPALIKLNYHLKLNVINKT